jgi:hypothetical protein
MSGDEGFSFVPGKGAFQRTPISSVNYELFGWSEFVMAELDYSDRFISKVSNCCQSSYHTLKCCNGLF